MLKLCKNFEQMNGDLCLMKIPLGKKMKLPLLQLLVDFTVPVLSLI